AAGTRHMSVLPTRRVLQQLQALDMVGLLEVERLRRLRNKLVHEVETPGVSYVLDAAEELARLISRLVESPNPILRDAAARVLARTDDQPPTTEDI
ncbi:MAG TPA: hypothetical protein V6D19_09525, partial [Stenomitos sp.]